LEKQARWLSDWNAAWLKSKEQIGRKNKIIQLSRIGKALGLSVAEKKDIYYGLVASNIHYCDTVWGNNSKENTEKIERLQNFGMRVILGTKIDEYRSAELRQKLGWVTAESKVEINKHCLTHDLIYNKSCPDLFAKLVTKNTGDIMNTRNRAVDLVTPATRTQIANQSIAFGFASKWNKLPFALKRVEGFHDFHQKFLTHFVMIEWENNESI
jgi:hypothetical protein